MTSEAESDGQYRDDFIARLQFKWGEGFLSPGGAEEVAELLQGANIQGRTVLDIGCGLGAVDILLVEAHGAESVIGVDVEKPLLDKANELIQSSGSADRIKFQLVDPGPLPFSENSFDVVFSKDALIHISDKNELYKDIYKLLRPQGLFIASDWYKADEPCNALEDYMTNDMGFSIELATLEETSNLLTKTGFIDIRVRDRHDWFRAYATNDLNNLKGPMNQEYIEAVGVEAAQLGIRMNEKLVAILDTGELRPGHLHASKPV